MAFLRGGLRMDPSSVEKSYLAARDRYAERGIDTEKAMARLQSISLSIHCWQGDDVGGFESRAALRLRVHQFLFGTLHHDLRGQSGEVLPGKMREERHQHDLLVRRHRGHFRRLDLPVNFQCDYVDLCHPALQADALALHPHAARAVIDLVYNSPVDASPRRFGVPAMPPRTRR